MEWLTQNWIWIVLALGALWLVSRARHGSLLGGGHGMAHGGPGDAPGAQASDTTPSEQKQAGHHGTGSSRHRGGCC
ncbi:MAG TPA: hypothetical protein VF814_03430 [Casimicrobiaceae bacterium]